ncbi:MAG: CRTAC1 family protein [Planctomycetota bacterium]|nr:MAG: CRTAC1 family protein [Planctomycetota bacterium]
MTRSTKLAAWVLLLAAAAAAAPHLDTTWTPQRPEFEALADRIDASANPAMGRGTHDVLKAELAQPDLDPLARAQLTCDFANEQLRLGQIDAAIETLDAAIAALDARAEIAAAVPELYRVRALAHLRRAEIDNCVRLHNRECCIFPLRGGGEHTVAEPARLARADYLEYLRRISARERGADSITATWLLNITCMALAEYPDGVPAAQRIPPAAFESRADIGRFVDVAEQLGVDSFDRAGGVIVDDFDGDGRMDIVSSTCDPRGPLKAYRNTGDGRFEDVAAKWRLDDQLGGLNIVATDYDNDGRLDILVLRGGWLLDEGRMRLSLLHNDADGRFSDVTREAGLVNEHALAPTQTGVWADFDNDGWLDLYVGHESRKEFKDDHTSYPSQLFRNNRDGTFEDVTARAGVANDRYAKAVAAGDYDGDGDMDLYVSNVGKNRLYRNDTDRDGGELRFTDVAPELHTTGPNMRSFACWFFDYDNDADLDLWVGDFDASVADVALGYGRPSDPALGPRLYRNDGQGAFTDVARSLGLDRAWLPMGANFGDFDNDGWLDIYLGTGNPSFEALTPNVALRNDGGLRFQDITQSAGLGHLQKGHGISFVDIDDDGDQDVYHQLGGFFPDDPFRNALFVNPGHGQRFLKVELVGVRSNRMAVGARLAVRIATPAGPRTLHRAVGCVSSFGGSPRRQELGLADATAIESLEVWWPASGERRTYRGIALDSNVRITEGSDAVESLARPPIRAFPTGK